MSEADYFYEVAKGHGLPHDPFKAIVAPRPIGWISTRDPEGRANLAPYSFFNAVCDRPPMLAFSSAGYKDTVSNIEKTGEFVYNMASKALAAQMNISSAPVAHEINEFELAGLTEAPCRLVKAPRVAEAPAALECKLIQIVPLRGLDGESANHFLTIGQVVGVHIDPRCLKDGRFDLLAAAPILRAGYLADYAEIAALFQMTRPK